MPKVQICRVALSEKGPRIVPRMAELLGGGPTPLTLEMHFEGFFAPKKEPFVFSRDVNAARLATDEEVSSHAKWSGFDIATKNIPGPGLIGTAVKLAVGAVGAVTHSGDGMKGVVLSYSMQKGNYGRLVIIGESEAIDLIMKEISPGKICSTLPC